MPEPTAAETPSGFKWTSSSGPPVEVGSGTDCVVQVVVEKRKPIYDHVQLQLLEKPGHLFLFTAEMIDVTQQRVQGFSQHPTTTLWSYQNVWLEA